MVAVVEQCKVNIQPGKLIMNGVVVIFLRYLIFYKAPNVLEVFCSSDFNPQSV